MTPKKHKQPACCLSSPTSARQLLILGLALSAGFCRGNDEKLSVLYSGSLSALSVPASALGEGWSGPSGLVVDDFADLSNYPAEVKPVVEGLKQQFSPIGVIRLADFTYRKKSDPLHQITLRVFLFDREAACQAWWAKKYRYDGWEKHYKAVNGVPYDAVDSKQTTKRAVTFGNVWMTCGTLHETDDLELIDLYIKKFKSLGGR